MEMSTLGLAEILDLPVRHGSVIRAVAELQAELPVLFAERFLVACHDSGRIIARAGSPDLLAALTELRVAPGFVCGGLADAARPGVLCLGSNLWAAVARLPVPDDIYLLIGKVSEHGGDRPGWDPQAELISRYLSLKAQWCQVESERQQFDTERGKLQAFYELTSELSELKTPEEILAAVARQATELMEAGTTIIYGLNPSETRLIPLAGHQIPPDQLHEVRYEIRLGETPVSRVHETGHPVRIDDVGQAGGDRYVPALKDLGLRSVLMVPIRLRDRGLGVMVVGRYARLPFDLAQAEVLSFVAHQIALILDNAGLRASLTRRLTEVDKELTLAREMQALMVPQAPLKVQGVETAGATWAAKQLGGDYLDYFASDTCLHVIVADIMGKGVSAALLMAILRSHFRTVFQQESGLNAAAISRLSQMVYQDLKPQRAFATAVLLSLDLASRELSLFLAGHHAPLLFGTAGMKDLTISRAPAFGLFNRAPDAQAIKRVRLQPGDALLAFTDGVTDTIGAGGERLGTARLQELFTAAYRPEASAEQMLLALRDELTCFAQTQPDDTTMCVLKVY